MSKVALLRCENYDYAEVKKTVARGINLLGGIANFAKPQEHLLLKPNLLAADVPESCVTTHPAVFHAVAELFQDYGVIVSYGDSPAMSKPEQVAKTCGIADVAKKLDIPMADFHHGTEIFFREGVQNKKFTIAKGVLESEGIISLPKLKTHGYTKLTGAIKNQFGCIPGLLKGAYHVKLPDVRDFAKMLVDLNHYLKPRLFIMDGIMAMEGNGPRGGTPKKMNVLLFSADPVALDATVCRMIGVEPAMIPTVKFGKESGLGTYLENEIELLGDEFASFVNHDFKISSRKMIPPTSFVRILDRFIIEYPYIIAGKCKKCGVCVQMCPVRPKALDWHDDNKTKPPTYNYSRCIKCFCCQELCPENAIKIKVPRLNKIFFNRKK
jgi:uncharacterized protein (DUF362 family)/NAD-dependent dihydropyrimidine dehydrogenase PreA subunit